MVAQHDDDDSSEMSLHTCVVSLRTRPKKKQTSVAVVEKFDVRRRRRRSERKE